MRTETDKFIRLLKSPLKFRIFLFLRIPSAFFSGVRVREITGARCQVSVPYRWFSQNPFRSTYFACLSMAAEMSTGALAMAHSYQSRPAISMLVIRTEAGYFRKATGMTTFTCEDGIALREAIHKAFETGEPQTYTAKSTGVGASGEQIAEFLITWSFKAKK